MVYMAESEMPWEEITAGFDELKPVCEDPWLQDIETRLRRRLFVAEHLETDHVMEPDFCVQKIVSGMDYGLTVQESTIDHTNATVSSHHYEPVIRTPEDIEKIRMPNVVYDEQATLEELARCEDLMGDVMPVKICGFRTHTYNAWDTVVCWTGVTEALMDLVMRPDYCHAIMRRLTDAVLMRMDQFESLGLLDAPNPRHYVGSGCAGFTDELPQPDCDGVHYRYRDVWGSSTSQIFAEVSPEMHEEFAVNYEAETLSRCGLTYYGCCEPLHNKMAVLDKIPNLRKVSISPWCDTAKARENATRKYVFSLKPSPAVFAAENFSIAAAEADVRNRLEQAGEMTCEVVAKDISTCRNDPQRLIDWTRMAMRVAREVGDRA
jgi:hypothetical protein